MLRNVNIKNNILSYNFFRNINDERNKQQTSSKMKMREGPIPIHYTPVKYCFKKKSRTYHELHLHKHIVHTGTYHTYDFMNI